MYLWKLVCFEFVCFSKSKTTTNTIINRLSLGSRWKNLIHWYFYPTPPLDICTIWVWWNVNFNFLQRDTRGTTLYMLIVGVRERSDNVDSCRVNRLGRDTWTLAELMGMMMNDEWWMMNDPKSCSDFDENFLIISL